MKLAFASCASPRMVPDQPVWTHIAVQQPDVLVLLGDNIYSDVPDFGVSQLQEMGDIEFAEHMVLRYREQLAVPSFAQLIATPGLRSHATWDDHDFLWNDANDAPVIAQPQHAGKIQIASSLLRCFRAALDAHDPARFPEHSGDPRVWDDWNDPGAAASLVQAGIALEPGARSFLHISDGRSFRRKGKTLLGDAQRQTLGAAIGQHPDALHILASGSVYDGGHSARWASYKADRDWLQTCFTPQRPGLMLSGDIHYNEYNVYGAPGQRWLVDITSSGAAIQWLLNMVVTGPEVCNHGLIELDADEVRITLSAHKQKKGPHANFTQTLKRLPSGALAPVA